MFVLPGNIYISQVIIVKLHSDLRVLNQLQLDGVRVDFVFAQKKEEEKKKPELPNMLEIWWLSCLEVVWMVASTVFPLYWKPWCKKNLVQNEFLVLVTQKKSADSKTSKTSTTAATILGRGRTILWQY